MHQRFFAPLCVLLILSLVGVVAAAEDKSSVQFILADDEAAEGLTAAKIEGQDDKPIYLQKTPVLGGEDIEKANALLVDGRPTIEIAFTDAGQKKMAAATEANIGKRLALRVKGKVIVAPRINSKIAERAQLTGNFTLPVAEQLAKDIAPATVKSP